MLTCPESLLLEEEVCNRITEDRRRPSDEPTCETDGTLKANYTGKKKGKVVILAKLINTVNL